MVKLEEIEFMTFLPRVERFFLDISIQDFMFIKKFVKEHNITNYEELSQILNEYTDVKQLDPARHVLNLVIGEMNRVNETDVSIEKYITMGYDSSNIDEKTIIKTEQETYGKVLPFSPPTGMGKNKENSITKTSIADLKYLLSHITPQGKSAFTHGFYRISTSGALDTIKLINFFENQIIRQHEETLLTDVNLFDLNKKEKRLLIEENLSDIISYLISLEGDYIWGGISSFQDKRFLAVISPKTERDLAIRQNLIEVLSDYTTLGELETGFEKTKCLDRFKSTN